MKTHHSLLPAPTGAPAHYHMQLRVPALLLALLLLAALFLVACGGDTGETDGDATANNTVENGDNDTATASDENGKGSSSDEGKKKSDRKRKERTTSVKVSNAFRGDLVVPVIAEGTLRARHTANIRSEIAGRVNSVTVREGQFVRRGTLLAKLDDREYALALEEARSDYFQALSLLAIEEEQIEVSEQPPEVRAQIRELERLEKQGAITAQERMAREIQLDLQALKDGYYRLEILAARSGIAEARAGLERAKIMMEKAEVRAPFDGVVTGIEVSTGEQITAGDQLCVLVNNKDIEAQVGVLEADIGKITADGVALLVVPALDETLRVKVDVISPAFDRDSRTLDVLLRISNDNGLLRPGMFVRAVIAGETFEDRLLVPKESILTRDGRPLLFMVEGDRAKWIYLALGEQNDNFVEIERVLQGGTLEPGDPVVVADHLTLSHDAKVKIKKTIPISDPWGSGE